jgi:protoporphyrinogen oxidase
VIGAGLSGLAICDMVNDKEHLVLIEKHNRHGGRIKTIRSGSSFFEIGSQFFCKSDENFFRLVKKKNLEKDLVPLDFSNMSFYLQEKLNADVDEIISVIEKILKKSEEVTVEGYFDEWFLKNFDKDYLYIPKGIIRAITFSDSSYTMAYYGKYILETFFEECYTFQCGLEEIIHALKGNIDIQKNTVKEYVFENDIIVGMETENGYIETRDDIVISTAPPHLVQINNHTELSHVLKSIKFNGCVVVFFKMHSIFPDWPDYIFFPDQRYDISVIEQFSIEEDHFIGCLIPYQNPVGNQDEILSYSQKFIEDIFNMSIQDLIIETFYYDWIEGMPIVDNGYVDAVNKLAEMNLKNMFFAGDYSTLYPSMDSAVKSSYNIMDRL